MTDYYLEYVHKLKSKFNKKNIKKNIIYFSSNYDRVRKKPIDLNLLKSFYFKMKKLKLKERQREFFVKLHPSENHKKYTSSEFFKKNKIKIIKNLNILEILKNFEIAGGCETYALAISKAFGLKTFNNIKKFYIKPILGKLYKIEEI